MKRRTLVVLAVVGAWWWRRNGDARPPVQQPVMAAVTPGGFAALVGPRDVHDSWRVVEVTRGGETEGQRALRVDGEVRLVGTSQGPAVGWLDGGRLKLATLDEDGRPENVTTWGKRARQLCEGAASNAQRFGIGWLEADGRVWFVHGPLGRLASAPEATEVATAGTWCGIASAQHNVVLLWREGARLVMNFCGAKSCANVINVPLDRGDALLGFGCVGDSCLFAARDKRGVAKLVRVTTKGRAIARTVDDAAADTAISVVGAGSRAFAIAYVASDKRTTIRRVGVDGDFTQVYHLEPADFAPAIAWAADKLVVVLTRYRADWTYALDLPGGA